MVLYRADMLDETGRSCRSLDIGFAGRNKEPQRNPTIQGSILPSQSDVLSQFGPELGSEIVRHVSQQGALEDANVVQHWRAPPIMMATSRRQSMINPALLQPTLERPISPENSTSIWTPQSSRFRAEEDELLLDFVAGARRRGLDLSSQLSWNQLEEMVSRLYDYMATLTLRKQPRHDLKLRCEKKSCYL
jgi:hypothetical protein